MLKMLTQNPKMKNILSLSQFHQTSFQTNTPPPPPPPPPHNKPPPPNPPLPQIHHSTLGLPFSRSLKAFLINITHTFISTPESSIQIYVTHTIEQVPDISGSSLERDTTILFRRRAQQLLATCVKHHHRRKGFWDSPQPQVVSGYESRREIINA